MVCAVTAAVAGTVMHYIRLTYFDELVDLMKQWNGPGKDVYVTGLATRCRRQGINGKPFDYDYVHFA